MNSAAIVCLKPFERLNGFVITTAMLLLSVTANVRADIPRPEHPRPDLFRANWLTLNGEWQFEIDRNADGEARGLVAGKDLATRIIVPFCPESKLSGIGNTDFMTNVWYRRLMEIPASMKGKRILLHFGGVDYKTTLHVNGKNAGVHIGGSAAFDFDITRFLKDGTNEFVVQVFDDTRCGTQPTGKQSHGKSEGCVYTRVTGIWQSVWLEAVGSSYVRGLSVIPDPDNSRVLIDATVDGPDSDLKLTAEAFADSKPAGSDAVAANGKQLHLVIKLTDKRFWEPLSPFLYDLKLTLTKAGNPVDEVASYFGLRKVTIEGRRILINDKPVFQRLILDQGFYPDGIWTAPSDEALKHDIEMSMACGYNGARLHQKVFEPRYLYWADKLGYLVWGEFPNWGYNYKSEGYAPYVTEWTECLLRDRNHPAIVGWCPFNETANAAGEIQQVIWKVTKAVDPTRPALETSGWVHTLPHPEVLDAHDYDQNPEHLRKHWMDYFASSYASAGMPLRYGQASAPVVDRGVPFMISEFGGIGWATEGGWGYGAGPKTIEEFYNRYKGLCDAQLDNPNFFGFCYTQLTDVEQEHNGLYYYDRRPKFDINRIHDATAREAAYERNEPTLAARAGQSTAPWNVLVGAMQDGALNTAYRYMVQTPQGAWTATGYEDKNWSTGFTPFGRDEHRKVRTPWTTADIYLRKTFEYIGGELKAGAIVISYDEDTEVFVNGEKVFSKEGFVSAYQMHLVTEALRKALKPGTNTLAVHTHQTTGGQYIDLAILVN